MDLKAFPMDHHNLQIEILFPDQNCLVQPNPSKSFFSEWATFLQKSLGSLSQQLNLDTKLRKNFQKILESFPK